MCSTQDLYRAAHKLRNRGERNSVLNIIEAIKNKTATPQQVAKAKSLTQGLRKPNR